MVGGQKRAMLGRPVLQPILPASQGLSGSVSRLLVMLLSILLPPPVRTHVNESESDWELSVGGERVYALTRGACMGERICEHPGSSSKCSALGFSGRATLLGDTISHSDAMHV